MKRYINKAGIVSVALLSILIDILLTVIFVPIFAVIAMVGLIVVFTVATVNMASIKLRNT